MSCMLKTGENPTVQLSESDGVNLNKCDFWRKSFDKTWIHKIYHPVTLKISEMKI